MNILIIDKEEQVNLCLDFLSKKESTWNIFHYENPIKTLNTYKTTNIDIVIVDFSVKEQNDLLNEIINLNPLQKTITLSKEISTSELEGCEACLSTKNRRRLMKPLDAKGLYELLKNFDTQICKYYNGFKNIKPILSIILKQFIFYSYDEGNQTINHTGTFDSDININELLEITRILTTNSIAFEVTSKNDIKIL